MIHTNSNSQQNEKPRTLQSHIFHSRSQDHMDWRKGFHDYTYQLEAPSPQRKACNKMTNHIKYQKAFRSRNKGTLVWMSRRPNAAEQDTQISVHWFNTVAQRPFFHNQVCGELILYPEHIPNDISLYTDSFQPPTKNYSCTMMKWARHNIKNLRHFIRFSELCPICLY